MFNNAAWRGAGKGPAFARKSATALAGAVRPHRQIESQYTPETEARSRLVFGEVLCFFVVFYIYLLDEHKGGRSLKCLN
jgi:hypothetical protein